MANFFKDNPDLRFYLEKGLDWEPIVELTEYLGHSKDGFEKTEDALEFYGDILDLIGQFVGDDVAPYGAQIDREGVHMKDGEVVFPERLQGIFDQIKALELHGMCLPRELGGQNCPLAVYLMALEIFARADVSVCAHFGFHGGLAMAMLVYSLREGTTEFDMEKGSITSTRWATYIEEIRQGEAWGCMDITEPDAGSDMAKMRTVGEQDEDGNWFVTGQKIFITSGHGKYHFVIARTETISNSDDPMAGLSGLSMFLVPTYSQDKDGNRTWIVSLDRLEEKLGHHGSATAALTFDRAPADLVGKRGEGFQAMLMLMNNARLGVGFESLGCMEAALRAAKAYAAERGSMGKTIDRHEMIADYIEEMETDIAGIRAMSMYGTYHQELAQKIGLMVDTGLLESKLKDDWRAAQYKRRLKHHKAQARRATPLIKYIAAEKAVFMAQRAVQIHGGNGYTTDYPAEKLLRDAMVFPIYEGTSQIQSLMAMKDTLGSIIKDPKDFIKRMAQARWRSLSARDPLERRVAKIQWLSLQTQQHLMARTAADKGRSLQG
ncbi:MAG: alkylation response protein AidB-like acyl-CoA dehydrogenase, partial [Myxococcota bacterium]